MKNFRTILAALLMLCCATLSAHDFEVEENIYYDLSGRRVENPVQGIYIVNGKKVLVK